MQARPRDPDLRGGRNLRGGKGGANVKNSCPPWRGAGGARGAKLKKRCRLNTGTQEEERECILSSSRRDLCDYWQILTKFSKKISTFLVGDFVWHIGHGVYMCAGMVRMLV